MCEAVRAFISRNAVPVGFLPASGSTEFRIRAGRLEHLAAFGATPRRAPHLSSLTARVGRASPALTLSAAERPAMAAEIVFVVNISPAALAWRCLPKVAQIAYAIGTMRRDPVARATAEKARTDINLRAPNRFSCGNRLSAVRADRGVPHRVANAVMALAVPLVIRNTQQTADLRGVVVQGVSVGHG